jgi:hypothetical protein
MYRLTLSENNLRGGKRAEALSVKECCKIGDKISLLRINTINVNAAIHTLSLRCGSRRC